VLCLSCHFGSVKFNTLKSWHNTFRFSER